MSPSPRQSRPAQDEQRPASLERVEQAAYECFERFGIDKTTIEDVAAKAGLSRATIYKHFRNKDELVTHITALEIAKVNAEVRARFVRKSQFADSLAECLLLVVRSAMNSRCLRMVLHTSDYPSKASDPGSEAHRRQRAWWGTLLDDAAEAGEFASDLSMDEIVSWLTNAEQMLVIKLEAVEMGDDELRHFIHRMIVLPLLLQYPQPAPR